MSSVTHIPIFAVVTADERRAVEQAAKDLTSALSKTTGQAWTCGCVFVDSLREALIAPASSIVITSLGVSLAPLNGPWSELEREMRESYAELCQIGAPILICTLLRHVSFEGEKEIVARKLRRIRQLNLLATELSREYGALVIDIDRIFAGIGARVLNTDHRLQSPEAIRVASNVISLCVTADALDTFVGVEVQQAARALLEQSYPKLKAASDIKPPNVVAFGRGRSKQLVSTVTDVNQVHHAAWLARQFLAGQIGLSEAGVRLSQAMRRRGVRESAVLLFAGITQLLKSADKEKRR
jgi:hypothetical protein